MSQQTILYRGIAPMRAQLAAKILGFEDDLDAFDAVLGAVAEALARTETTTHAGVKALGASKHDEFVVRAGSETRKARVIDIAAHHGQPVKLMLTRDLTVMSSHEPERYDRVEVTITPAGNAAWAVTDLAGSEGREPALRRQPVVLPGVDDAR